MLEWEAAGDVPREESLRWRATGFSFMDVSEVYRPKGFEEAGGKGVTGLRAGDADAFHLLVKVDETARILGGVGVGLEGLNGIGMPPGMCDFGLVDL